MKKLAKRVLLLFAATIILASATPLLQAVVPQVQNTAYAQADDTEDTEAANEEQMEACYDDYAHITGTDIDLPKNPLRWFTCAVGQTLIEVADGLNRLVMRLLFFDPTRNRQEAESFYGSSCEYTTGDANCASTAGIEEEGINQLRKTWGNILTLANIILVVAFLIMVISTALDLGVFSNYTIKKMLPRIIIAAIAANLSWGICSILVQTVNNIGIGVGDFMTAPFVGSLQETIGASGGSGSTTMGALLIAAIGAFMVAIYSSGGAILLVILATVALVIGVAFLVVIIRRILLTLLIVVAPFAFIAWAVPGGEGLFKKWWKLFSQMLLLFPVTMVLFAAGIIVAALAGSVGTGIGGGYIDDIATSVVALISIVAPYAMIPYAIKLSSGVLGNIANIANDKSKGMLDRSRNWGGVGGRKDLRDAKRQEKKDVRKGFVTERGKRDARDDILDGGRYSRALRSSRLGSTRLGQQALQGGEKYVGQRHLSPEDLDLLKARQAKEKLQAPLTRKEMYGAQMDAATLRLGEETNAMTRSDTLSHLRTVATSDASSSHEKRAAIKMLIQQKDTAGIESVQQAALTNEGVREAWMTDFGDNYGNLKAVSPHLATEVGPGATLADVQRRHAQLWSNASNEQLANMHHTGWVAYRAANRAEADRRFAEVTSNDKLNQVVSSETKNLFGPPPPAPSDYRLKRSMQHLGRINGHDMYRFKYLWSDTEYVGVMAQDLLSTHSSAVSKSSSGYYLVDYSQLNVDMTTYDKWINQR